MTLWMAVTPDDLELPIAVADSIKELAAMLRTTQNAIWMKTKRKRSGSDTKGYRICKVRIDMKGGDALGDA